MTELPNPIKTGQPKPKISTEQATVVSLFKDVTELRRELDDQRKENKNFIYFIIAGVVAIVVVVAIEIILFHTSADKDCLDLQSQYFQEVKNLQEKNYDTELRLQKEIDELKLSTIKCPPVR